MKRCYRAHPFYFVNVPASGRQGLAEKSAARAVTQEQESFRSRKRDMPSSNGGAGLQILSGQACAGAVEAREARHIGLLGRKALPDQNEYDTPSCSTGVRRMSRTTSSRL